jgi:Tfp pilus assembly protein PilF
LVSFVSWSCSTGTTPDADRERAYRVNNRGVALLEQFKYPEAQAAFREALQIDGSMAMARVNLSLALFYARDLQGAAREAAEAARLLPTAAQPPYILGLIAYAENRAADARREFERVRQMDAGDVGTNIGLGQLYLEAMEYPRAVEVLRQALDREPYNVTAAYNLGLALARGGRADEGQQMLQRAQALRASGYSVTYGTGYLEQGRYAEAIASTGAEDVDTAVPPTTFTPAAIGQPAAPSDPAPSPLGRDFLPDDLTPEGFRRLAAGLGGGVALLDIENDGDLDVFSASTGGARLFRNEGRAVWSDATAESGVVETPGVVPIGAMAGDFNNDGQPDLFVLGYGGNTLYRNDGRGRFSDVSAKSGIPPYPFLPGAAAFADIDHDGDLDLAIAGLADLGATRQRAASGRLAFPRDFAPAPFLLLRNNGNSTFTDITANARVNVAGHAIAVVPTDFDNRRDVDLLIVNRDEPPFLFQNLRDGTFRDAATETGLAQALGSEGGLAAVTAGDINKDEFPDFFFAREIGGVLVLSEGRARFAATPAPNGRGSVRAAQFVDYDTDGLLDLLTWSAEGPRMFRSLGEQGRRWSEVTDRALAPSGSKPAAPGSARALALADLDGDGHTDFVASGSAGPSLWRNSGTPDHRSTRVTLRARVSNRLGVGAKVQLRAGGLSARVETSSATPAVRPDDVVFGLGRRQGADAVRVLWPSGILQSEAAASGALPSPLVVEELDRKPSSCPFLFTWNGTSFEFVTDFMGGGEMGYWEEPGRYNSPDPVEYVRIRGDQLRPKDGRLELRVTNELEETLFADRLELLGVAHPAAVEIYPNEGMTEPPKPFRLFAVADQRAPRALDERGRDVTDRIRQTDGTYPDGFPLERFRGYAAAHSLTIDLERTGESPVLLLTGWTDYAFSSDNVAAHQAGLSLQPPSLQIRDVRGRWRTAIADIGVPVGRPQTIPVDLTGVIRPGEHQVRIVTNMRIYWDRIAVGRSVPTGRLSTIRLDPGAARLSERGFSREVRPGGNAATSYVYEQVSRDSPWKTMSGAFTREGDVRELLAGSDDMFVVAKPGDEIALHFDASPLTTLPDGWTRTFLLKADGFSKEMDINSASPDTVGPLPFHGMTGYPYGSAERYPETPAHERYRARYNTRIVVRPVLSIDGAMLDENQSRP